ncbi:hypothetical protein HP548_29890 [Paenibacillus taichungensis]|uniref:MORN repeat protein n=2 Tax=Paenibacillus taichungensis TaxID=484184 RepID=A0ABX2MW93_9BACL|nr:hypothetical protein [Paenibacillus taichungensis]
MKKMLLYVLGLTLCVSLFMSPYTSDAASSMSTLELGNGVTYYGETKNGKPHGYGTMTWGKSKTYKGNWVAGKRSGYGVYKAVTSDKDRVTDLKYDGFWKNDKKDGKGELEIREISYEATMLENRIQNGTFAKDQWISGYDVRHGEYDPPYYFAYKDSNLSLKILGGAENILDGLKDGYFFSFTYQKGKVYKDVGVGDEFSQKQFSSFIKSVEKEIKPHINQFEKLAQKL